MAQGKESACQCSRHRRCGSDPWVGRSPQEGNGNPLQYSCLENPMDRGDWQATIHGVTKSQTWLSMQETVIMWLLNIFKLLTWLTFMDHIIRLWDRVDIRASSLDRKWWTLLHHEIPLASVCHHPGSSQPSVRAEFLTGTASFPSSSHPCAAPPPFTLSSWERSYPSITYTRPFAKDSRCCRCCLIVEWKTVSLQERKASMGKHWRQIHDVARGIPSRCCTPAPYPEAHECTVISPWWALPPRPQSSTIPYRLANTKSVLPSSASCFSTSLLTAPKGLQKCLERGDLRPVCGKAPPPPRAFQAVNSGSSRVTLTWPLPTLAIAFPCKSKLWWGFRGGGVWHLLAVVMEGLS